MTFEVGEVVTVCNIITSSDSCLNGSDVTIVGARGSKGPSPYHWPIDSSDLRSHFPHGDWFSIEERYLRKRPQPPEWNKLADPKELPIEDKVLELA
jgi:hypothetical protein